MSKYTELTDSEWRSFQAIPEQGYSHRHWVNARIAERLERIAAENAILRGPDSDERDALITAPIIRQLQSVRAEFDAIAAQIDAAPHDFVCSFDTTDRECDCWKSTS